MLGPFALNTAVRNAGVWDAAIFAIAGYIAVVTLVRAMIAYRNKRLDEVRQEAEDEARRKRAQADDETGRKQAA